MRHVLCLGDVDNLAAAERIPVGEILLQTASFSRTGAIKDRSLPDCLAGLSRAGKKVILAWDILAKDKDVERLGELLESFADRVDAVRFADPGVGLFLKENFPGLETQFSLEHCNANTKGISGWIEVFSPNLRRLILSNQIPISNVAGFKTEISRLNGDGPEIELLALGRLQIFYSARRILGGYIPSDQARNPDLTIVSRQNGDDRSCPALENDGGTIIFYHKDICLIDREKELEKAGADALRFEFYHSRQYRLLARYFPKSNWAEEIKKRWEREVSAGFFHENPTYRSLRQITNQVLRKEKESRTGTVIEAVKNSHVLIETRKEIQMPADMELISPEGRKTGWRLQTAVDLRGEKYSGRLTPGYYLLPWIRLGVPGAVIRPRKRALSRAF